MRQQTRAGTGRLQGTVRDMNARSNAKRWEPASTEGAAQRACRAAAAGQPSGGSALDDVTSSVRSLELGVSPGPGRRRLAAVSAEHEGDALLDAHLQDFDEVLSPFRVRLPVC